MSDAWPYNDKPDGLRIEFPGVGEEERAELEDLAWSLVIQGLVDSEEFAEIATDDRDLAPEAAEAAYDAVLDARFEQQQAWTEDIVANLDLAFDELEDAGIIARQAFTCCGTCGHAEIGDERDGSRHWRGYVFFHEQDADRLAAGEDHVYLAFGAWAPADFDRAAYDALDTAAQQALRDRADEELGREIVAVLERHGLPVTWDGRAESRILAANAQFYVPLEMAEDSP